MSENITIDVNFNTGRVKFEGDPRRLKEILLAISQFVNDTNINEVQANVSNGSSQAKASPAKKPSSPKRSKPTSSSSKKSSFDANSLANKIKNDERFDKINSKIIMVEKDFVNKAKFILSMSDEALNSGDVLRTLLALNIKANPPALSKALSNNRDQFIVHDTSPKTYSLSTPTKASVEMWIQEDNKN